MRVHTFTPYNSSLHQIIKRIKYKIYDYGDMCIIAFSATQVECYRFVDRRQEGDTFIEVLEKQPIGYTPPVGDAVCSVVDIGITKDPSVFIYGNYLLRVSETAGSFEKPRPPPQPTNVFEQMASQSRPTHTKQFKRKPLENRSTTSIPLVMPTPVVQPTDSSPKKHRTRVPMMSIPLVMPSAAME
jgi:hypothetical protein